ncbi:MAG: YkgJ family cysteine cluster protein [Pyrinomonadaceae bacterium]
MTVKRKTPKLFYDCTKCPAYCCSVYERVKVTRRDISRLARYFGVSDDVAEKKFTKLYEGEQILRRKKDPLFGTACKFLNTKTRGCGIYHARPTVCRQYPTTPRCAYYDLLQFERCQQDDQTAIPLVKIEFRTTPE